MNPTLHAPSSTTIQGFRPLPALSPRPGAKQEDSPAWELRRELASAVVQALDISQIPYCILGASENELEFAGSDLDFLVRPQDSRLIPALLASAAQRAGGHLVQAISHECTAAYFIMAKQCGSSIGFSNPDCTTDYRRERRLWFRAEELLAGSQTAKNSLRRPPGNREFLYYLVKQVLKQTLTTAQWRKLLRFYAGGVHLSQMTQFWTAQTAEQMRRALAGGQREWFQANLAQLRAELLRARPQESRLMQVKVMCLDMRRLIRRVLQPTGVFVRVTGGRDGDRNQLAVALAQAISPAFRRCWMVAESRAGFVPLRTSDVSANSNIGQRARISGIRILRALIRSTLVICVSAGPRSQSCFGGLDIDLRQECSADENLQCAISTTIAYLSHRTARQLGLISPQLTPMELALPEKEAQFS